MHRQAKHQKHFVFITWTLLEKHKESGGPPHSPHPLQLSGFAPGLCPPPKSSTARLGWEHRGMFSSWKEVLKISLGHASPPHFDRFSEVQSWFKVWQSWAPPRILQQWGNAWLSGMVNRILLDEERRVQFPAIICCLTCKCMLRQSSTAAPSCAAVRFKGWKLQGMLFPGWAPASEGSSRDLSQSSPFVSENRADFPSKPQFGTGFLHHSICFREQEHTNGNPSGATDSNTSQSTQPGGNDWTLAGKGRELINIACDSPLVHATLLQLVPCQAAAGMLPPAPGQELALCCTAILLRHLIFERKQFAADPAAALVLSEWCVASSPV